MLRSHVVAILGEATGRITTREIASRLRARGIRCEDHEVGAEVDVLLRQRIVVLEHGRWRVVGPLPCSPLDRAVAVLPSAVDANTQSSAHPHQNSDSAALLRAGDGVGALVGRWALFRRLLRYYIDCVVQAERPSLRGFLDSEGEQWLFARQPIPWDRIVVGTHGFSIVLNPQDATFQRNRLRAGPDESVYLGYPVEVVRPKGKDAWAVPIFVQPFRAEVRHGVMHLVPSGPVTVNGAWLDGKFLRADDRDGFLRSVGLFGRDTEGEGETATARGRSFADLATRALDYVGDQVVDPIRPGFLSVTAANLRLAAGIHNRAMIVLGPRLQYTRGLIRELANIGRWSDEELDETALAWIFPHDPRPGLGPSWPVPLPHSDLLPGMIASLTMLSESQRAAVGHALTLPGLIVTGPPGTGKSELVATILVNQILRGRSALFASKNHRALDAVIPRLNGLSSGGPLIIRASNQDIAQRRSWRDTLRELLSRPDVDHSELADALHDRLRRHLSEIAEADRRFRTSRELTRAYELASLRGREAADRAAQLSGHRGLVDAWREPEHSLLLSRLRVLESLVRPPERGWVRRLLWRLLAWRLAGRRRELERVRAALPHTATCVPSSEALDAVAAARREHDAVAEVEAKLRSSPRPDADVDAAMTAMRAAQHVGDQLLDLIGSGGASALRPDERAALQNLRAMAVNFGETRLRRELPARFPSLLRMQPLWAVSSLSARAAIPLGPAMFDLVIIDEASQCDIASSVPLLARARRAVVVGDPRQLQHVTTLSPTTERTLLETHGLTHGEVQRLSFRANSCYDIVSGSIEVPERILLTAHYRSHPDIASFASELFYGYALECATDPGSLRVPPGARAGIHWTDVVGAVEAAPSGVTCRSEINAVRQAFVELVRSGYDGSVGVVTPFRQQANHILDALSEAVEEKERHRLRLQVSTAHGFQGDERDVILLSLCCGPDMPAGSLRFIADGPNLFNVAITRARAVLHVFGNKTWALGCDVRFVRELARRGSQPPRGSEGPAPFESPWEERFAVALRAAGIDVVPQHPVANRRLDLAILSPQKLDLEVDGEAYHRTASGARKDDDLWRDLQLQALGWRVCRFWVYELRDDMAGCVERVRRAVSGG